MNNFRMLSQHLRSQISAMFLSFLALVLFSFAGYSQANFVATPSSFTNPGGSFSVTIALETNSNQVIDLAEIHLNFDPAVLQVTNASFLAAAQLPIPLVPIVFNNTTGSVDAAYGNFGPNFPVANINFAQIDFQVIGNTDTSIDYNFSGNRETIMTFNGNNVLSSANNIPVTFPVANQDPVSSFTANPTSGTAPLTVNFNGNGSSDADGSITSYAWVFGDGNTASGATASNTYTNPGSYTASLTVTDNDGATNTSTTTITVSTPQNTPPNVTINGPANNANVTRGASIGLLGTATDSEDGNISGSINWTSNDVFFSTTPPNGIGAAITAQFVEPGPQTLTASVTDSGTATDTDQITVNVSAPEVTITSPAENATVTGTNVTLQWTSVDVLFGLTEHFHIYVNPPNINNIDTDTRISTASAPQGQQFWNLTAIDGLAPGANTIVIRIANQFHEEFTNPEAQDIVNFNIQAPDVVAPVITLNGNNPETIDVGANYVDAGATALDNVDGSVTVITTGNNVNTAVAGTYTVSYSATDAAGNTATASRTVVVQEVAATNVFIVIDPNTSNVNDGDNFSVTVEVQASTQLIDLAEIHLTFDPAVVNVSSLTPAGPLNVPIVAAAFDNTNGTIDYAGGVFAGFPSGTFDLITINFQAVGEGSTALAFVDPQGAANTTATFDGTVVLTDAIDGTVNVAAAQDNVAPVITLNGNNPETLTVGGVYVDAGATALDNIDGPVVVITTGNNVNTAVPGTYTVSYSATDAAGNTATASRSVIVNAPNDTIAPVITLNGNNPETINQGTSYVDAGATAFDNVDGVVAVITTGNTVNTAVPGTYTVSYSATDAAGNTATASRSVIVQAVGNNDVFIVLDPAVSNVNNGDNFSVTVEVQANNQQVDLAEIHLIFDPAVVNVSSLTPVGPLNVPIVAAAFDNTNGTIDYAGGVFAGFPSGTFDLITINFQAVGAGSTALTFVNPEGAANTTATFDGNEVLTSATDGTVNVSAGPDLVAPVITLNGNNPETVNVGTNYVDAGATAVDNVDGPVTVITTGNNVNTAVAGTYTVSYSATDAAGNTATASRSVIVQAVASTDVFFVIDPAISTVNEGEIFTVDVLVQANSQQLDVAEIHLNFDQTLLAVQDVTPGTSLPVDLITPVFDNGAGTIDYAGGAFSNFPSGTFTLATISFQALTATSGTTVAFNSSFPRATTATFNVVDVLTGTTDGTVVINEVQTDVVPPVITLNGNNPETLTVGGVYVDAGATALDNIDGPVAVITTGNNVNTAVAGTYTVTYSATDAAGNTATASRTVIVQNVQTGDVAFVISPASTTVTEGASFTLDVILNAGSQQVDFAEIHIDFDNSLLQATNITVTNTVLPATVVPAGFNNTTGEIDYAAGTLSNFPSGTINLVSVTFTAQSAGTANLAFATTFPRATGSTFDGNELTATLTGASVTITEQPTDVVPPVITLNGNNPETIDVGTAYVDAGATAVDNVDGPVAVITTGNNVNTAVAGTYTVTYSATDAAGNVATASRTVVVQEVALDDVFIVVNPANTTAFLGQTFTIDVVVNAGAQPLDGAEIHLDFDPSLMQVSTVIPGNVLPVGIINQFNNTVGTIDFAAGTFSNFPSGSFTLVSYEFTALAPTASTPIDFAPLAIPRLSNATFNGLEVLTGTTGGTVEILNTVSLTGVVALQGRQPAPNAAWSIPLTVNLYQPGTTNLVASFNPTTDNSGFFTITGITPGSYDISVKNSHTLQNVASNITLTNPTNTVNFGTLLEGDANNDNFVSLVDFSILSGSFNLASGSPGYDDRADFNEDNVVSLVDFSLLSTNFNTQGQLPGLISNEVTPRTEEDLEEVFIHLNYPAYEIKAGSTFEVEVEIQSNGQKVDGAELHLSFNPLMIQIEGIIQEDLLPLYLLKDVDNSKGRLNFAVGALEELPNGAFKLAKLKVRALQNLTTAPLKEAYGFPSHTDATYAGQSILGGLVNNGLTEEAIIKRVALFPNPTQDVVTINFLGEQVNAVQISIISQSGKVMQVGQYEPGASNTLNLELDELGLPNGVYFMQAKTTDHTFESVRFVKQ